MHQSSSFGNGRRCVWFACLLAVAGCGPSQRVEQAKPSQRSYTIHIDRSENGAAQRSGGLATDDQIALPRKLAFEVSGVGRKAPAGATQEQRAAARQAAIIDAFVKALIEARRSRGQPVADFTAKLGPRLTVIHRTLAGGDEVEVRLLARGVQKVFVVRDGVLQHLPHDFSLVRKIFEETHGEFSLLPADPATGSDVYVARVGCYVPAGMESALVGDLSTDDNPDDAP